MRGPFVHVLLLSLATAGCAAAPGDETPEPEARAVPTLDSIAPHEVTLGDEVKVIGKDFLTRDEGRMAMHLVGTYTDSAGAATPFEGDIALKVENASVASFVLDDIYFTPTRDKIGTFSGTAELVGTLGGDLEPLRSPKADVDLRILPSIRIERMRAVNRGCGELTGSTSANTPIELRFSGLGMGDASASQPWKVKLSFVAPAVAVRYIVPGAYDFWPINGPISDTISAEAGEGVNNMTFDLDTGHSMQIDPTRIEHSVKVSPPIMIGNDLHDELIVQRIATGAVEYLGVQYGNFVVEMDTGGGRILRRNVTMEIWNEVEVALWDGEERLLRRYSAEATSGCIPGGQVGIDLSYTEGESISRSRSVGYRWDSNAASSLGFAIGPSIAAQINGSQNWSETFGVDVNESVSSEAHMSQNLQAHILPSFYGMSFRQLEQLERRVEIRYHNVCGASGVVGEALLTNWNFGFDVAQGESCPPPTNLPPAENFDE